MITDEILSKLSSIVPSGDGRSYSLMSVDGSDGPFFGKNDQGDTCFVIRSRSPNPHPSSRSTSKLVLIMEYGCVFRLDDSEFDALANILICKSRDDSEISAFVRLCSAFASDDLNSRSITELFSSLTRLFSIERQTDRNVLSGLFGELFTMLYLESHGIDVFDFWQRKNLMKYDFCLNDSKRMEVKTVSGDERRHHFRHEQLYYEDYDIIVVSVMLREANVGISMFDVVEHCRKRYSDDYSHLSIIEDRLSGYSEEDLRTMIYDRIYLDNNIRFVPAVDVPRFKEKSPSNVSNAQYDCYLGDVSGIGIDGLRNWMK